MKRNTRKIVLCGFLAFALFVSILVGLSNGMQNVSETFVGPPNGFIACSNKDGEVSLSWDAVDNAIGYEVWQSINDGDWSRVQIITGKTNTSYGRMNKDLTYSYKICAWSGSKSNRNCGDFSGVLSIIPCSGNNASAPYVNFEIPATPETTPIVTETPVVETTPTEVPKVETTPMPATPEPTPIVTETPVVETTPTEVPKVETTPVPTTPEPTPIVTETPIVETTPTEVPKVETTPTPTIEPTIREEKEVNIILSGSVLNKNSLSIAWTNNGVVCNGYRVYQKINDGEWKRVQTISNPNKTNVTYSWLNDKLTYSYKVVAFTISDKTYTEIIESNVVTISFKEKVETTPIITETPKKEETTKPKVEENNVDYVSDILTGTNDLRSNLGLSNLTLDNTLCKMAQYRVDDMAKNKYFSHYKNDELQLKVVRDYYGYSSNYSLGENIARTTAQANIGNRFVNNWTKSSGHYKNMTNSTWTKIGIAVAQDDMGRWYGVQIFSN